MEVIPLRLAELTYPESHPWHGRRGVVYGFAVRRRDSVVLVDTGLGAPHPAIDPYYKPARTNLMTAMSERGIRPRLVSAIINTHLHFDHCGGNPAFPGTPIYVQRLEKEAAIAEGSTIPECAEFPGARYELREGDFSLGDGIEVLATPGRTVGHQSVLVHAEDGAILVAGHAIGSALEWERKEPPSETTSAGIRSAERLSSLEPRRVYFSHHERWFEPRLR